MKARLYSEIGPIERQEAIPLVGDAMMRLQAVARDYVCGKRLCDGLLGVKIDWAEDIGTVGFVHCMADPKHRGIRRPRMSPKPYGLPGNRRDESLHV